MEIIDDYKVMCLKDESICIRAASLCPQRETTILEITKDKKEKSLKEAIRLIARPYCIRKKEKRSSTLT